MEVLVCLAVSAGEVVSREQLLQKIWPGTFVTDDALKRCVFELRRAFNDDANRPNIIETIPKRGYRLIATVERVSQESNRTRSQFSSPAGIPRTARHSVGRENERAHLKAAFECARAGRGLLVCVAGEPGIGKTTLVHDFFSDLQDSNSEFNAAIGRCSQRLAGEEAYLPFLEALDDLAKSDGAIKRTLAETAPGWYAQLFPAERTASVDAALQRYARATTQENVKRELAGFLGQITIQHPLVLFFDDVHWTDPSTIDLLSHLATKFDTARILVIVTYRPTELFLLKHPFIGVKRELQGRALCRQIEMEFLSPVDVERYISLEFLGNSFPPEFARLIHSRTEGNPLFMVDLLRYLRDRKIILKTNGDASWHLAQSLPDLSRNSPQSVSSVIERKIDQLSDRDREVLTTAAVQGYEFDSAALALALEAHSVEIEDTLDRLERVHAFARRAGEDELPSGKPTLRYRFVHVLYQNALYASLTPSRRLALSGTLARALEGLYGEWSSKIASQLAFLYETARDPDRASDYFLLAAQNAQGIFANPEAIALARRGLALLDKIPETLERTRKELDLQVTLAFSFLCTRGYAAPETGANMAKARELCEALGDAASLFPVIFGLWTYYLCKGDMKSARETAEHLLSISHKLNDSAPRLVAHAILAITLELLGELIVAREQFEEAARHYDFAQQSRYIQLYRLDPGIQSDSDLVRVLWLLGFPDQAGRKIEETLTRARAAAIPVTLAFALRSAAWHFQNLRQPEKASEVGEACIALCDEHGILLERAWVKCPYGWAIAELGQVEKGISHIRAGLEAQWSIGAEGARGHSQAISAEALWHAGLPEEALHAVEDGLAASSRNGDNFYDAELWRLKGELLKRQDKAAEAEVCFQKALQIARQQAARSLELRAATSLARLWQEQGNRKEAQRLLGEVYGWFTEGFDTADLKEAASLLAELDQAVPAQTVAGNPSAASRCCDSWPGRR